MDTQIEAVGAKKDKAKKTLRVGFIGMGGIANHHANLYKKLGGVDLVCGCDIRQEALDHFKNTHGIQNLYTDFKKMVKEFKDVDAIDVCTPNGVHAPAAIAAADAGLNVFCEKPMAMSAKEARMMADAAKRNKVQFVMGFQHRYEPRSFAIREQIESGKFGKIMYVRAQALRRRGIPNWGVFGQKKLQGGGPMIDIGVHILDTAYSIIELRHAARQKVESGKWRRKEGTGKGGGVGPKGCCATHPPAAPPAGIFDSAGETHAQRIKVG